MKIDAIVIGHRYRKDMGNLDSLAKSIEKRGLLHPPVVTADRQLVCGFRRIKAAEKLGWEEIEVRVIDPDDMLLAEHDENECREDFAPSERVAIAREIERRVGSRQGQKPTSGQLAGSETREKAAKAAGFSSTQEYRRTAAVVDNGVPELVEAVDEGKVSPSAAAKVAKLPKAKQRAAVKAGPKAVKEAAKAADEPPADPADEFVGRVNRVCKALDGYKAEVVALAADPLGRHIHAESVTHQIDAARKSLWQSRPTEPCNCLKDGVASPGCKACFGCGKCPASRVLKGGR